jgi:hypothetical protein
MAFEPRRANQLYHRQKGRELAKGKNRVSVKVPRSLVSDLKHWLSRKNGPQRGVSPLPGNQLWFFRQAALWLKKRLKDHSAII